MVCVSGSSKCKQKTSFRQALALSGSTYCWLWPGTSSLPLLFALTFSSVEWGLLHSQLGLLFRQWDAYMWWAWHLSHTCIQYMLLLLLSRNKLNLPEKKRILRKELAKSRTWGPSSVLEGIRRVKGGRALTEVSWETGWMSSASEKLSWKRLRKIPWIWQLNVVPGLWMKGIRLAVGEKTRFLWVKKSMSDK